MRKSIRLAVAAKVFAFVFVFFAMMMAGFDDRSVVTGGILGFLAFKLLTGPLVSEKAKTK